MSAFALAMTRNRIAEGKVDREKERLRVTGEFRAAKKVYQDSCAHVVALYDRRASLVATIQQDKDNMEGFVNGWLAAGEITGKNDAERKACLAALKESDTGYCGCEDRVRQNERTLKIEVEPEIVREEQHIRMARYDMEFAITEGRMIAGEQDERHQR